MAHLIVACTRDPGGATTLGDRLRRCAEHLSPDNITSIAPDVRVENGLARAVVNPVPLVRIEPRGVCLGDLFEEADWATTGSPRPDGSCAIVRHDARSLELVSDVFASRTFWYLHSDDAFYASTSQRALVALLGSFALEPEAVTWMLAAGNLGPECGWDARFSRVPARTCLRLDRETWQLSATSEDLRYAPRELPAGEHVARLREAIFAACAAVSTERAPAALALSGGCDSRSLLAGLAHAGKTVTCVTWGLAASRHQPLNDAVLAPALAEHFGMPTEYLPLDWGGRDPRATFTRFLLAGEGRIEDIGGYTDGLDAWGHLSTSGLTTVLRGDAPGWGSRYEFISEKVTRAMHRHCTLVRDHAAGDVIHRLGLTPQRESDWLFRCAGEAEHDYRDRIYNDFMLPTCMAAYNDVKCAYGEVVNPLFARDVVTAAVELPGPLRQDRAVFKQLSAALAPGVPFAEHGANAASVDFLGRLAVRTELLDELGSEAAGTVLTTAARGELLEALDHPLAATRSGLRRAVKRALPERFIRTVRAEPRVHAEPWLLAYRAYLASRMAGILAADARAVATGGQPPGR